MFSPSAGDGSAHTHWSRQHLAATGKGPPVLVAACACGNKRGKKRGYRILRAYEIVFLNEGQGDRFNPNPLLAKGSVKSLG